MLLLDIYYPKNKMQQNIKFTMILAHILVGYIISCNSATFILKPLVVVTVVTNIKLCLARQMVKKKHMW